MENPFFIKLAVLSRKYKTLGHLYVDLKTPSLHGNKSGVGARDVWGLNAQDIRTERKNYFVLLDEELLNGYT